MMCDCGKEQLHDWAHDVHCPVFVEWIIKEKQIDDKETLDWLYNG